MRYGKVTMGTSGGSLARLAASLLALGTLALTSPVRADAPDQDAMRIASAGRSLKWNWTPPGRSERFGHAETLVHAPLATVRQLVLDFPRYKELASSITTSRVVAHGADGSTDVYLQMGVMNNTIKFWNVTRFSPLRTDAQAGEVLEGRMVHGKGNIDDSAAVWSMHPAGNGWTVLKFDVLLRPGLPAPQSLIDEQLRDSAMDAVNSIHDRAQGSKDIGPYSG
ncbi:MAG TPA: hypothetical protein VHS09_14130 [Polyangiaceae bacterium]|jgi:hypothetical protein|nr:hypothetical protein [Polyangiaceae bacterium]